MVSLNRCNVVCRVEAYYIGGRQIARRELRTLAPHFRISVQIEVTLCFKGNGVFQYVGSDYKYIVR